MRLEALARDRPLDCTDTLISFPPLLLLGEVTILLSTLEEKKGGETS